ncbi:hypothetical protein OX283_003475 [Flavobacterium sp. SUN052]|uniref:hypothetical protein n=1 Tax=Flavobacterium sp. SUN052 TaxID=3002441 RepID=UPI00237E273D|nr:hypothetical protein [Flavobacterium sp. SUN052]MEC4003703.1 hypothetical protein [Flavobacterium sp. SUN052]
MRTNILKNFILIAVTVLITSLIFNYMHKKKDKDYPNDDGTRSTTSICMDYDNQQPATLTTDLIKSMVTKYDNTQLDYIENAPGSVVPEDAKAIWFDIETLKRFLYHVEFNVSKNPSLSRDKKLGIRIYYAAYPKNADMRIFAQSQTDSTFSFNPDYENHHTLVMIPTITGADGENYDFNPLDAKTYDGFVNMKGQDKGAYLQGNYPTLSIGPSAAPATPNMLTSQNSNGVIARNHGVLFPPYSFTGFGF